MVQIDVGVPRRFLVLLLALITVLIAGCVTTSGGVAPAVAPNVSLPAPAPTSVAAPAAPTSVPTPVPPPTPGDLLVKAKGEAGSGMVWARDSVDLSARGAAEDGDTLSLEVEVVSDGHAFLDKPVARGVGTRASGGQVEAKVTLTGLQPGQYIWQARFVDADGQASSWVSAPPSAAFAIVGAAPVATDLAVDGAHGIGGQVPLVGASDQPKLEWQVKSDLPAALAAVEVSFDSHEAPPSQPPTGAHKVDPAQTSLALPDLKDGTWFAHVWVTDKAGQTGSAVTAKFTTQRTPPAIENLVYRSFATNPRYQELPIRFALSQPSQVDVSILGEKATTPLRTFHFDAGPADNTLSVSWDGKDARGQDVPAGSYRFEIQATDAAGNTTKQVQDGLTITNKVIIVTLANESLRALDGDQLFLSTLVTSGGQELPTRKGQFEIEYKSAPFVFHAPYPRGSRFWYPDTPANYAMLFDPPEGNFIHDAPWRRVFGPGTNGPGTPGYSVYSGSHGCVELPTSNMAPLFQWTPVGTPVIVQ